MTGHRWGGSSSRHETRLLLPVTCLLSLLTAEVTSSTGHCPTGCRCRGDDRSTAVTCHRRDLVHVPSLPEAVTSLDLDHNHISLLQNGSLHGVRRLEVLSLQDNGILHLEAGVFDPLSGLRVLRLGRNHLSGFPADVFASNRLLQVLDLHANYFAQVPDYVVHNLHSLQVLNVSFNQLTSTHLGPGFRYTSRLSVIDFSGNDLTSLESGSFDVMITWDDDPPRHVNLSHCNLRHIAPMSLRKIPRLASLSLEGNPRVPQPDVQSALRNVNLGTIQTVDVSHMNITDIAAFAHHFQAAALVRLELSYNRVKVVPKGTFFFFVELRYLGLGHNEISTVENLAGLSRLEYLDLAYNNIQRLDEMMFEGLHELKILDVSHNAITRIDDAPFLNLFNLQTLDISANHVHRFQISEGLESLETLRAGWNRVSDVRFLQRLRRLGAIDLCHNAITRLGEEIFARGQRINCANFSGNAIDDVTSVAFRFGDYDVIDLSDNRLTTLNDHGFQSVQVLHLQNNHLSDLRANSLRGLNSLRQLHLQGNRLRVLPWQLFVDLRNLTHLDLSFNPIGPHLEQHPEAAGTPLSDLEGLEVLQLRKIGLAQVDEVLLRNLTSLRRLDLGHNRLHGFRPEVVPLLSRIRVLDLSFNGFRRVQPEILDGSGMVIDLSGNPFDCSCELVPLCRRMFGHRTNDQLTVVNIDNRTLYQCASPAEWTGVPVSRFFDAGSRQCSDVEKTVIFATIGCLLLVVIVGVIIIITVAVCRYTSSKNRKHVTSSSSSRPPSLNYKFVDETSLTSSSNSSSNNGGQRAPRSAPAAALRAPGYAPNTTTVGLLSKQWV